MYKSIKLDWFNESPEDHSGMNKQKALVANLMKHDIIERGGSLASDAVYINEKGLVECYCSHNHSFSISRAQQKKGKWCDQCNFKLVGQEITKLVFELIFKKEFNTERPCWLKNPETGRRLELDGYNKELKIAFEHQGKQHEKFNEFWHKSEIAFLKSQQRDFFTRSICESDLNRVKLVSVQQINRGWDKNRILDHIEQAILKEGITIPRYNRDDFNLSDAFKASGSAVKVKNIVEKHNGTQFGEYCGLDRKIKFKCENQAHAIFETTPMFILYHNQWCPECSTELFVRKLLDKSFVECQKWLKDSSNVKSELLEKDLMYKGHGVKYHYTCQNNHDQFVTFSSIKARFSRGVYWCIKCYALKVEKERILHNSELAEVRFNRIKKLAKMMNMHVINKMALYAAKEKYEFKCLNNSIHTYKWTLYQMEYIYNRYKESGDFCPKCRGFGYKSIDDARELARLIDSNGDFLDDAFQGVKANHKWRLFGVDRVITFDCLKSKVSILKKKKAALNEGNLFPGMSKAA